MVQSVCLRYPAGSLLGSQAVSRKPYKTDLIDEQWAILEPLLPKAKPDGRKRSVDLRKVVNAIIYVPHTSIQ